MGILGILQPFGDALKLFLKQNENNINANNFIFYVTPVIIFVITASLTFFQPHEITFTGQTIRRLLFIFLLAMRVYPLLLRGWSSNSKYSIIGSIRGVAQTISYEISLALILMVFIVFYSSIKIKNFSGFSRLLKLRPVVLILWLVVLVAERNRTPFDFSEGESELVSGFNVEYASVGFVLIFLAEYIVILFFSCISTHCVAGWFLAKNSGCVVRILFTFFWIQLRATFPRFRYDLLINLAWKSLLPLSLGILLLIVRLSIVILYFNLRIFKILKLNLFLRNTNIHIKINFRVT